DAASHGPFSTAQIVARYGYAAAEVDAILAGVDHDGVVARGRFVRSDDAHQAEQQWCDRRNLAEAHRRTLSILRDRGAPATVPQYAQFLLERHRAEDVGGAASLLAGFRAARDTLERDLLIRRVTSYHPALLDA